VLLGLVLGPLAENRLFLSTDNYGWNWTTRPGVIGIFVLTLFGIFYPMIKGRREARQKIRAGSPDPAREEEPGSSKVQLNLPALFTVVVIAVLALALWQSRNFGYRAGLFPWVIGIPTFVLAIGQVIRDIYGRKKKKTAGLAMSVEAPVAIEPAVARRRTVSIIVWTIGFFLVIWLLGFTYAVPLAILLYLKFAGESWFITASVTFFSWLFYWALFEKMLNVPFPEGLLITLFRGGQ
jgi:hypothetical protein